MQWYPHVESHYAEFKYETKRNSLMLCVCVPRDVQVSSPSGAPEYHSATERSTNWMRSFLGYTVIQSISNQ